MFSFSLTNNRSPGDLLICYIMKWKKITALEKNKNLFLFKKKSLFIRGAFPALTVSESQYIHILRSSHAAA